MSRLNRYNHVGTSTRDLASAIAAVCQQHTPMPRFSTWEDDEEEENEDPAYSRSLSDRRENLVDPAFVSPIPQLACTHGDYLHLLLEDGRILESRRLPLEGSRNREETAEDIQVKHLPLTVRTVLPSSVQAALKIDPAVELVCAAGEDQQESMGESNCLQFPPLVLCSKKEVFVLHIAVDLEQDQATTGFSSPSTPKKLATGRTISWKTPLEPYLDHSTEFEIVRVRAAPQRTTGYATWSPTGSFAALVYHTRVNEYCVLMHHGLEGKVTAPVSFGVEQVSEYDPFVDFTFCPCQGLALLATMSIVLVRRSGSLYSVSPLLFDDSVVSASHLKEGFSFLEAQMNETPDRSSAEWCHARLAEQYLKDAFGGNENNSDDQPYVTARTASCSKQRSAVHWPVQLQGPLLEADASVAAPATAIETFGGGNQLTVGLAVAYSSCSVHLGALVPTVLLPRFAHEAPDMQHALNIFTRGRAKWVERVQLTKSDEPQRLALVRDPIEDTILHVATPRWVVSLSSKALQIRGSDSPSGTVPSTANAWVALKANSSGSKIQGVVVPGGGVRSSIEEHQLLACHADGTVSATNVGASQLQEKMERLTPQRGQVLALTNGPANDACPSFHETIQELVDKITLGVNNLAKIVGTETKYSDITTETLAVVLETKKRADTELLLPMLELRKIMDERRKRIAVAIKDQYKELKTLQALDEKLQTRQNNFLAKMDVALSNTDKLMERAERVQTYCAECTPELTKAERAYYQDLERLKVRCSTMEQKLQELKVKQKELSVKTRFSESLRSIDRDKLEKMNTLLNDQSNSLREYKFQLKEVDNQLAMMAGEVRDLN